MLCSQISSMNHSFGTADLHRCFYKAVVKTYCLLCQGHEQDSWEQSTGSIGGKGGKADDVFLPFKSEMRATQACLFHTSLCEHWCNGI